MAKHTNGEAREGAVMVRGKGTGFVSLPDFDEDVIIDREKLGTALDGDMVELALGRRERGRQTARVLRIIERARAEYIGVVTEKDGDIVLAPDSRRIHVSFTLPEDAREHTGKKVAVALTDWKEGEEMPAGEIVEVLGPAGDHETEMRAIMRSGGFAPDFPPDVQSRGEELSQKREEIFAAALTDEKRKDMREITTFTIDPHDAKDFDDALSFRELDDGNYEIGIHIADVSHYVEPGDAIDREAQERGTSVYLVDRVIPMLPEILSNDLCSLRPEEDRLAFSAVFTITPQAKVVDAWYGQTIIHSDKRFSYQEAQESFDANSGPFADVLAKLMDISRILRTERYKEGAIAFEQPEVEFELDEDGTPTRVYTKERIETMLMIEDFMLLANRKVAEHIYTLCKDSGRDAAFVYRVHDAPNPEKIEELSIFLHALGYEFETHKGVVEATDINKLLEEVEGTPEENLIKTATIRSMAKAVYTTKNIGHFGLAFKYYTHFTSPIRRYPDLMAHRLLRKHLDGSNIGKKELARYERLSVQSSEREASAVEAERDSIKFKQVEYMEDKVGQTFDAVISGVTDWGIYVEETETRAEGLVHVSRMEGDYFTHDEKNYQLKGSDTKRKYQLGDTVRVKLVGADPQERKLDFELVR